MKGMIRSNWRKNKFKELVSDKREKTMDEIKPLGIIV